jgi:hypothetical protein
MIDDRDMSETKSTKGERNVAGPIKVTVDTTEAIARLKALLRLAKETDALLTNLGERARVCGEDFARPGNELAKLDERKQEEHDGESGG